jgi:hypothetical protein
MVAIYDSQLLRNQQRRAMRANTLRKTRNRIDLVREARAGLIPASDDIADEKRARTEGTRRMIRAAKAYVGTRASEDQVITSILADVRHYCDLKGLKFRKIDRAARALYLEEVLEEANWFV